MTWRTPHPLSLRVDPDADRPTLVGSTWTRRVPAGDPWDGPVRIVGVFDLGPDGGGLELCLQPVAFGEPVMSPTVKILPPPISGTKVRTRLSASAARLRELEARAGDRRNGLARGRPLAGASSHAPMTGAGLRSPWTPSGRRRRCRPLGRRPATPTTTTTRKRGAGKRWRRRGLPRRPRLPDRLPRKPSQPPRRPTTPRRPRRPHDARRGPLTATTRSGWATRTDGWSP